MRFWDSSAILPLLVQEAQSDVCLGLLKRSRDVMVVWWGTPVECASAVCRRERDGNLRSGDVVVVRARLRQLRDSWTEVEPGDRVREQAERLLRIHPLRSADALQLAAAIIVAGDNRGTMPFLTLDARLREAADREGFMVESL